MRDTKTNPTLMDKPEGLSLGAGSKDGVLLIHGFTSTPLSLADLGQGLAEGGLRVEIPLLSGHGTTRQDLGRTGYAQWLADVEKAYSELKKNSRKVFVAGLSMGGALSLHLARQQPDVAGIILINHAIFLKKDWRLSLLPLFKYILPYVEEIGSDIKNPEVRELTYDKTPTKAVHQLVKLLALIRADLEKITQPCLIFKSREDHVIPMECAIETEERISSSHKRLIWLENSYHVATQDFDQEIILKETLEFIKEIAS